MRAEAVGCELEGRKETVNPEVRGVRVLEPQERVTEDDVEKKAERDQRPECPAVRAAPVIGRLRPGRGRPAQQDTAATAEHPAPFIEGPAEPMMEGQDRQEVNQQTDGVTERRRVQLDVAWLHGHLHGVQREHRRDHQDQQDGTYHPHVVVAQPRRRFLDSVHSEPALRVCGGSIPDNTNGEAGQTEQTEHHFFRKTERSPLNSARGSLRARPKRNRSAGPISPAPDVAMSIGVTGIAYASEQRSAARALLSHRPLAIS